MTFESGGHSHRSWPITKSSAGHRSRRYMEEVDTVGSGTGEETRSPFHLKISFVRNSEEYNFLLFKITENPDGVATRDNHETQYTTFGSSYPRQILFFDILH